MLQFYVTRNSNSCFVAFWSEKDLCMASSWKYSSRKIMKKGSHWPIYCHIWMTGIIFICACIYLIGSYVAMHWPNILYSPVMSCSKPLCRIDCNDFLKMLIHLIPLISFYTPRKHQNSPVFYVFRGYRKISGIKWVKTTISELSTVYVLI